MKAASGTLSGSARRIQKELAELTHEPPENVSAGPKGDNIYEWAATIVGPAGAVLLGCNTAIRTVLALTHHARSRPRPTRRHAVCERHLLRRCVDPNGLPVQAATGAPPPRTSCHRRRASRMFRAPFGVQSCKPVHRALTLPEWCSCERAGALP